MKIGVIIYHKNIFSYIKHEWIFECLESVYMQTFEEYDLIELNYGDDNTSILDIGLFKDKKKIFYNKACNNHIEAMNFILNKTFNSLNYDVIFNINLDDIYHPCRFELQLEEVNKKYDLVSSNYLIFQNLKSKIIERNINIVRECENKNEKDTLIKIKINKNKNIFPTSVLCFTARSWNKLKKIPNLPGVEGLLICKKLLKNKIKISVCDEILLKYRIHNNQITSSIRNKK